MKHLRAVFVFPTMHATMTTERGNRAKRTPLDERLDAVRAERGWTDEQWSEAAHLSAGYLRQQRYEARRSPRYRIPEKGAEPLAQVAGVALAWLREGKGGMRDGVEAGAGEGAAPREITRELDRPRMAAELALVRAYGLAPSKYTEAGFLAALDAVREGAAKLPADEGEAVETMGRVLASATRLRAAGTPFTLADLLWTALSQKTTSRPADDNAQGDRELAELGAERPAVPVRVSTGPRPAAVLTPAATSPDDAPKAPSE